ncbi:hypothetical protein ABL78_1431 [Leptomonas seymouri]|uniref:Uncharacterized protein n=1 Tax=Leptomonas seymouri TaxID=5684 RepID=A0A0N0P8F6_LEPSE|nr:hypothetical protein ABL78_1431 [Leptomonas seymouri]|eukprot:KPI89467.1 hypothetical protein ABL78_1431 [Leptomonas seymouri]
MWWISLAKAVTDVPNIMPLPADLLRLHHAPSTRPGASPALRLGRLCTSSFTPSRSYSTAEGSGRIEGVGGKPCASPNSSFSSSALDGVERTRTPQKSLTSRRFSHRRGGRRRRDSTSSGGHAVGGKKAPRPAFKTLPSSQGEGDTQSPLSSPSPLSSRRSGQRGDASACSAHGADAEGSHYRSRAHIAASETAPSMPMMLRNGRRNAQRSTPRVARDDESAVLTVWGDASALNSREAKAHRRATSDPQGSAEPTSRPAKSMMNGTVPSTTPKGLALDTSGSAEEPSFPPPARQGLPTATPTPFFGKTNKKDCAPLRKLLRDHKTFAHNFTTLKRNSAVVASFERLGAEALARSGLLEALAAIFMPAEETKQASVVDATSSARLVLEHLGGASLPSAASPASDKSDEIATLEVSQRVICWLDSPIEAPPLTAAEMTASVEEELAQFEAMMTRVNGGALRSGPPAAAQYGEHKEVQLNGAHVQWYVHWGQQQQELQTQKPLGTSHSVSTPPVSRCMSQWYDRHVLLSQVLLTHFSGVSPALAPEGRKHSRASRPGDDDASRADWRSLPRTGTLLGVEARDLNANRERGQPPTRPDQTLSSETRALFDALYDLLKTVRKFKLAEEGVRLMASPSMTGAIRGCRNSTAEAASALLSAERVNEPTTSPDADERCAAAEGGESVSTETAFAQLQRALVHAQHAEATTTNVAPSANPQKAEPLDDAVTSTAYEAASAARMRARNAGDKWRSLVSQVDVLSKAQEKTKPMEEQSPDAFTAILLSSSSSPSPTAADHRRPVANTRLYTVSALDLLLSVLLRCLLFYVPALPYSLSLGVFECLTEPWIAKRQIVVVSQWITQFAVTSLLTSCTTIEGSGNDCDSLSFPSGSSTQLADTIGHTHLMHHHITFVIRTVVKSLRLLCWPTLFDYGSTVVQRLFRLPTMTASPASASNGAHAWRDAVAVLESNPDHQCTGYALLLFFIAVVDRIGVLSTTPLIVTARSHTHPCAERNKSNINNSDIDGLDRASSRLSCLQSPQQHYFMLACFQLLDIDRFLTGQFNKKGREEELNIARFFSMHSRNSSLPSPSSCTQTCLLQLTSLHGLARQTFCTFRQPLIEVWPTMSPRNLQVLWDAFRYSIVAPVASVLLHTQGLLGESVEATEREFLLKVAETAEWQASAPVLRYFSFKATPAVRRMMWADVAAELANFPEQMKAVLQVSGDTETRSASQDRPSQKGGAATCAEDAEHNEKRAADALRACRAEFSELALMCAWLLVAEEQPFDVTVVPSADASATTTCAATGACKDRIQRAFTTCVKRILAVWTEAGTAAVAGRRFLALLTFRSAAKPTEAELSNKETMPDAFLVQLLRVIKAQVWTADLESLVQTWGAQTEFVQQQQRTLMPASPPPVSEGASTDSPGNTEFKSGEVDNSANQVRTMRCLDGLSGADASIRGWWRLLQAEDAELPSMHIYLLEVFVELRRIVVSREGQANIKYSSSESRESAVIQPMTKLSEPLTQSSRGERCEAHSQTETVFGQVGAAAAGESKLHEVVVKEHGDDIGVDAAVQESTATGACFSSAELVVILRLLASISTRGGLTTASYFVGASANSKGTSGGGGAPAAASAGSRSGSILEALFRVAAHSVSATTAAAAATSSSATSSQGGNATVSTVLLSNTLSPEESGAASGSHAAFCSIADVQHAIDSIEKALLDSISANATFLPAASLLEAAWLGLYSLSSLSEAFQAACISVVPKSASSARASAKRDGCIDASHRLPSSLRTASSEWLKTLHKDVCASAHTRLMCCLLLYRHYNVLRQSGVPDACSRNADETAYLHVAPARLWSQVASPSVLVDESLLKLELLADFFALIRRSCVESLVLVLKAETSAAADDEGVASKNNDRSSAVVERSCSAKGMPSESLSEAVLDAAATATPAVKTVSAKHTPEMLLKGHARHFLQVFVLASELHDHLSVYEARRASLLLADERPTPSPGEIAEGDQQTLMQLYAALLAAAEAFLPFNERSCSTEVAQMVSIITWRMRHLGLLRLGGPLSLQHNGLADRTASRDDGDEGAAAGVIASTSLAAVKAPALTTAACLPGHANYGTYLLRRYCAVLQALIPCAYAEVLAYSKELTPYLLRLLAIISAKVAAERAMRGILMPSTLTGMVEPAERASELSISASNDLRTSIVGEGQSRGGGDAVVHAHRRADSITSHFKRTTSGSSSTSTLTPPFAAMPTWPLMPLEALLHRAASSPALVQRHGELLCALAVLAPELSAALTPISSLWRDSRHTFSPRGLELAFMSLAACARTHRQQSQEELYRRDGVSLLATSMASGNGGAVQETAAGRTDRMRRSASHDLPNPTRRGEQPPSFTSIASPTVRIGEMCVADMPHCGDLLGKRQQHQKQHHVPIYRSVGVLTPMREAPPQLRRAWVALARRVLDGDSGSPAADLVYSDADASNTVSSCTSLWVMALHCGGVVGVAETQLFEQLLASFVFSPVSQRAQGGLREEYHDALQQEKDDTRVARLDAMGWTLLVEACASASGHCSRQGYRLLLKDALTDFLNKLELSRYSGVVGCRPSHPVGELSSSIGPALCGLLEAIPKLFIEDLEFWEAVVRRAVVRCCDGLDRAGRSCNANGSVPTGSLLAEEWSEQWRRSFNFAVASAGHGSLAFPDDWTDRDHRVVADATVESMEQSIRGLKQTLPASVASVRAVEEDNETPHGDAAK